MIGKDVQLGVETRGNMLYCIKGEVVLVSKMAFPPGVFITNLTRLVSSNAQNQTVDASYARFVGFAGRRVRWWASLDVWNFSSWCIFSHLQNLHILVSHVCLSSQTSRYPTRTVCLDTWTPNLVGKTGDGCIRLNELCMRKEFRCW